MKRFILLHFSDIFYMSVALIQILFIWLKIMGHVNWSWLLVVIPMFIIPISMLALFVTAFLLIFIRSEVKRYKALRHIRSIKNLNNDIEKLLNDVDNGNGNTK